MSSCICSPDVAALLATMPTLRQPAPPPGIPAGIPPMRKANAPPSQVPCKHFAQGNCSKGDKCDFAHEPKQQGRNASKSRSAPHETPPVCVMPLPLLSVAIICSTLPGYQRRVAIDRLVCAYTAQCVLCSSVGAFESTLVCTHPFHLADMLEYKCRQVAKHQAAQMTVLMFPLGPYLQIDLAIHV